MRIEVLLELNGRDRDVVFGRRCPEYGADGSGLVMTGTPVVSRVVGLQFQSRGTLQVRGAGAFCEEL